jgi:tryptophan halogenase
LGGGSAGCLAALGLKRTLPHLEVTLVESPQIPIIGVGEATTPLLQGYLHGKLGLDMADFYLRAQPTWKLGIRFDWGLPGNYYFNYTFDKGYVLESYVYEGSVNPASFQSLLMTAGKSNLFKIDDSRYGFWPSRFAYHIENRRFVNYLKEEVKKAGVRWLQREVVDADLAEDGETVRHVVTSEGEQLPHDLFVDCSGFRSLLLEKALGSRFVSYGSSLFNDVAITAGRPRSGDLPPYATARTMRHGWCWEIPLLEGDHVGYVFSSAHCSAEEAEEEMSQSYPDMEGARMVRFRSGRHEEFWKGNVVAVGNAFGFVEPLESTALHLVCMQLAMLIDYFPATKREPETRRQLNEFVNEAWDEIRWFLAFHFKFNRKLSTRYWQDCQHETEISGNGERILESYRERCPISYRHHLATRIIDDYAFDLILLAQKVPCHLDALRLDKATWSNLRHLGQRIVDQALSSSEMLEVLGEHPELLRDLAAQAPWLKCFEVLEGYPSGRYDGPDVFA